MRRSSPVNKIRSSLPGLIGLIRQSIRFRKIFSRRRWMRRASPRPRPALKSQRGYRRTISLTSQPLLQPEGLKTGGRQKGSRNKGKIAREEAAAKMVALVGEVIPDAFAGDAHAVLVPRTVTRNGVRLGDRYT